MLSGVLIIIYGVVYGGISKVNFFKYWIKVDFNYKNFKIILLWYIMCKIINWY